MSKEPIEGEIGRYVKNTIRGWCRKKDVTEPMRIECLLDDVLLGEYLANEPRKRLEKKGFLSINHGFSIGLNLSKARIHKVEIRDANTKQSIPNNPTLIGGNQDQSLIFFVHIPKTAGTSLRFMLDACFKENDVFPNQNDIRANEGLYPELNQIFGLDLDRLSNLKLINGHYPMQVADNWLIDLRLITFFRRPAERVVSHLKHLKKNDKNCRKLSLKEIYFKHKGSLVNLQLRILKNRQYTTANLLNFESTSFNEQKLVETLNRFTAFGIVEEFDQSMAWISDALSLDLGKAVHTNQSSTALDISFDLKSEIEADCKIENQAYELIKSEFYRRSAYLDINPNLID